MNTLALLHIPGWQEILLIVALALLFFSRRIPGLARSIGQGFFELRRSLREEKLIAGAEMPDRHET